MTFPTGSLLSSSAVPRAEHGDVSRRLEQAKAIRTIYPFNEKLQSVCVCYRVFLCLFAVVTRARVDLQYVSVHSELSAAVRVKGRQRVLQPSVGQQKL